MTREIKLTNSIIIKNGGFEQGILEAVNQDGLLSDVDKERLKYLKSLPQDRTELLTQTKE